MFAYYSSRKLEGRLKEDLIEFVEATRVQFGNCALFSKRTSSGIETEVDAVEGASSWREMRGRRGLTPVVGSSDGRKSDDEGEEGSEDEESVRDDHHEATRWAAALCVSFEAAGHSARRRSPTS